jgi:hypothetical protein
VQWYEVPKGAKLAKRAKAKPILIASGTMAFSGAATGKVMIRLTVQGERLLKHARHVQLGARTSLPRWTGLRPAPARALGYSASCRYGYKNVRMRTSVRANSRCRSALFPQHMLAKTDIKDNDEAVSPVASGSSAGVSAQQPIHLLRSRPHSRTDRLAARPNFPCYAHSAAQV